MSWLLPKVRAAFPARRRQPIRWARLVLEELESRLAPSVNVLSFHDNTASTGLNANETQLSSANVKVGSFGKLYTTGLDGQVYAEPLVDTGVIIAAGPNTKPGAAGLHDVVFVATENDTLYALDASVTGNGTILWQRSFLDLSSSDALPGATSVTTVSSADVGTLDITPVIGITGTPVINGSTNTLYIVTKTKEMVGTTAHFVQRLHAINIADGTDRVAPYTIGDTSNGNTNNTQVYTYGSGDGSVTDPYNGTGKLVVQFNALRENERAALSLVNNEVYVSWASHGDNGPYHGWVAAWDVSHLTTTGFVLKGVFNSSPNGGEAGIWMGAGQLAFEPDGSAFYFTDGNGPGGHGNPTLNASGFPTDGDYYEAIVKVVADSTTSPTNQNVNGWGLKVADYFIPHNQVALDNTDEDFGSGAPLLLPASAGLPGHPNLLVTSGKEGKIYLIDRNNMGKFDPNKDNVVNAVSDGSGTITPPVQVSGVLSTPAYFNGTIYYVSGYSGSARAFTITSSGTLNETSQTSATFGYIPGSPDVSANGTLSGIVWVMDPATNEIHAYDATTLATELWNSGQKPNGLDSVGAVVKFATPTEANGELFVGTTDSLDIYGLTPPANAVPNQPTLAAATLSGSSVQLSWTDTTTLPNLATGYLIEDSTDDVNFTQVTTAPAGSTSLSIGGLSPQQTYYFRIRGFNGLGNSAYSNVAQATTTNQVEALDLSAGFAGSTSKLTYNGSAASNGTRGELTNGGYQAGSFFSTSLQNVAAFVTHFMFQLSAGPNAADGIAFVIQAVGPTALGSLGGGLGYGADPTGTPTNIASSVAVKFDTYNNQGEGPDSTGLYTDGAPPTNAGSIDLSNTGIDLHSGDVFQVTMTYDGTTLAVAILDTTTNKSATQNYPINIPGTVGGTAAYVGFTGGTGSLFATQDILTWTYGTPVSQAPSAPTGLGATPASATSVNLTWTNNATNQTGHHLDRATDPNFTQNLITENLPATPTAFTDAATGLAPGGTFYYRLRAFNAAGDSGNSNVAQVSIPLAPPKPTDALVTNVTTNEIDLSWTDNAGRNADGYRILRAVNHGSFAIYATLPQVNNTPPTTYTWSDTNVLTGTFYEYHIQAYNVSGNNDFSGTNAITLSLPPTSLSATPSSGIVTLTWTAPAGAASYNVYRGTTPGGEGTTPFAAGVTTTSFTDSTVVGGTAYYYTVTAVNANTPPLTNESAASNETSTIPTNPPTAPAAPSNLIATVASATAVNLTWRDNDVAPNAATGYNIMVSINGGTTYTQAGTANAGAASFAVTGLQPATTYTFQVVAVNNVGSSPSNTASAITSSPPALDFSTGFAASGSLLTWNQSAKLNGTKAEVTDGGRYEAGSVFSTNVVSVTQFATQFTFQLSAGASTSDGFTFTIQGVGPKALGALGGGLGYSADPATGQGTSIGNSVAVKFDLYNNGGEGVDSTGLYLNGAAPTLPSINLSPTGINLHSSDVFKVLMSYDGTTLNVTITDTTTNKSAAQSYPVNIPAAVGAGTGYVGFTGGTGSLTAVQNILTWVYSPTLTTTVLKAPTSLSATAASGTQVNLAWTNNATGQLGFHLDRATSSDFKQNLVTQTAAAGATTFSDGGLLPGTTYYYRVRTYGVTGDSANSNTVSITTPRIPAAPTNPQATLVTATGADLSWTNNASNATSVQIFRQQGPGPMLALATLAANANSFFDTGLLAGTAYTYAIQAVNSAGPSAQALVTATTAASNPSGFSAHINFSSSSAAPAGWVTDTGAAYGSRANGLTYGWLANGSPKSNSADARSRNAANSPDKVHDGLIHMQKPDDPNAAWQIVVPNGTYLIHILTGDPTAFDSVYSLNANGVNVVQATPSALNLWADGTQLLTVTNGLLTVTSGTGASNSKIDAIDILPAPAGALVKALNAGGGTAGPFTADNSFSGGTILPLGGIVDSSGVSNPGPQAVYQTQRGGNFTYTLANLVPNGGYTVQLFFAELVLNGAGLRTFNVAINGSKVLSNFDVFQAAGGFRKAVAKSFAVTADSKGKITLTFTGVKNTAIVNAIEVLSLGP